MIEIVYVHRTGPGEDERSVKGPSGPVLIDALNVKTSPPFETRLNAPWAVYIEVVYREAK